LTKLGSLAKTSAWPEVKALINQNNSIIQNKEFVGQNKDLDQINKNIDQNKEFDQNLDIHQI
jgi:hypothetical protein